MKISNELSNKINKFSKSIANEYTSIPSSIIEDIVIKTYQEFNSTEEFEYANKLERILGLSNGYFSSALRKNTDIKALIVKEGCFIKVKLDFEIKKFLNDGYICCKINSKEKESFDYTINLTRNILLGFYK